MKETHLEDYKCISNRDDKEMEKLKSGFNSHRLPFCSIEIPTVQLSHDKDALFRVVEAKKQKNSQGKYVYILRILIDGQRGVNVTIPYTETLYQRYLDLRYLIRNSYSVQIRFPHLFVQGSVRPHELMLIAYCFHIIFYE